MNPQKFLETFRNYVSQIDTELLNSFIAKYLKINHLVYSYGGVTEEEIKASFENTPMTPELRESLVFASINNLVFLESLFDAEEVNLGDFGCLVLYYENGLLSFRLLVKELSPVRLEPVKVIPQIHRHIGVLVDDEKTCILFIASLIGKHRLEEAMGVWKHFQSINFLWRSISLLEEFINENFRPLFSEMNYVNLNTLKLNANIFKGHFRELWWKYTDPDIDDFLFVIDSFMSELDSEINRLVFFDFPNRSFYHEEWMDFEISKFHSCFNSYLTSLKKIFECMNDILHQKIIDYSDECISIDANLWKKLRVHI